MNSKTPAAFMASALILSGCHTITENEPPRTETASNPSIIPVILNPVTLPAPTPTPTTPLPSPAAPEPPKGQGCGVGPGTGSGHDCPRQSPSFLKDVESAMDQ